MLDAVLFLLATWFLGAFPYAVYLLVERPWRCEIVTFLPFWQIVLRFSVSVLGWPYYVMHRSTPANIPWPERLDVPKEGRRGPGDLLGS